MNLGVWMIENTSYRDSDLYFMFQNCQDIVIQPEMTVKVPTAAVTVLIAEATTYNQC